MLAHVWASIRMQVYAAYARISDAGKMERFSEQQLTDCSWKFGANHACDGGDYDNAIDYLVTMGGIAREDDYEYLGQDNFCSKEYMAYTHQRDMKLIKVKVGTRPSCWCRSSGATYPQLRLLHLWPQCDKHGAGESAAEMVSIQFTHG